MTKLKFDSLSLGFNSFKLIPKKRVVKHDGIKKLTTKLVRGVCLLIDGEYRIKLDITTLKPDIIDKEHPDILIIPFTEKSYELKGMISVFSKTCDDKGRYTRYIRRETNAKFLPGNPEKYVPFCHNWVCSGYIVRCNGKLMFDFNECIAPQGYTVIKEEDE